jgi:hypothetical protein
MNEEMQNAESAGERELIKRAMSLLGKRTSLRKALACRKNARRPRPNARGKPKRRKAKREAMLPVPWGEQTSEEKSPDTA